VPRSTQVFMFGWYACTIVSVLTKKERDNVSWELVLGYLDALAKDYSAYEKLTRDRRADFWRCRRVESLGNHQKNLAKRPGKPM
jgi:hypothetical protein